MLKLSEIEKYYDSPLRTYKRFILREYLQYKILQLIYESSYSGKLIFLGGTCLRIVHNSTRFSEDIDFDNFNLTSREFKDIALLVKTGLQKEGYEVEIKNVIKGAFHCYIRFPGLMFNEGISGHREEKILIQLDTEPQNFEFSPQTVLLNKFDVFTNIFVTPPDLLLSQKCFAALSRKRNKGRDFYDISFLLGFCRPNYDYLQKNMNIHNGKELKENLMNLCDKINLEEMGRDVEPFIFNPLEIKRVKLFKEFISQVNL